MADESRGITISDTNGVLIYELSDVELRDIKVNGNSCSITISMDERYNAVKLNPMDDTDETE